MGKEKSRSGNSSPENADLEDSILTAVEGAMADKVVLSARTIQILTACGLLATGAAGGGATATGLIGQEVVISADGTPSPSLQLYVEGNTVSKEEFNELKKLQEQDHRMLRKMCLQTLDNPLDCDEL